VTDYARYVRKYLTEAAWQFQRRGKGDHDRWINPVTKVTVDKKIKSGGTANGILKEAGIGKKF
jgi:hypothetical protein